MKQWSDGSFVEMERMGKCFSKGQRCGGEGANGVFHSVHNWSFSWTNGLHASVQMTNRHLPSRFVASDYIISK